MTVGTRYTETEQIMLGENSIERVINTSVRLIRRFDPREARDHDTGVNLSDWEELKPLVLKLWRNAQNEIWEERSRLAKERGAEA